MVQIFCKNNEKSEKFEFGTTLLQIYDVIKPNLTYKPVCAVVNNQIQGLTFRVFGSKEVEYLDYTSEIGRKVYMRSFTFVLYKAVEDLLPGVRLVIEAPVSKGYFFTLRFAETNDEYPVSLEIVQRLKTRIKEILAENHRFHRIEAPTAEVAQLFRERGMEKKAKLVEGIGRLYCYYYKLADTVDYFYGPLVPSTEFLDVFDVVKYYDGILLQLPRSDGKLAGIVKQEKMLQAFREDRKLADLTGISTVGELNELARNGVAGYAIKVAEALQEKRISRIADKIAERPEAKIVLIAGPSSSGKTTFSKRLCVQLMACGLKPKLISLDDYFVDRTRTPIDENGEYDYESIYSLDLDLFHQHLKQLLNGEEVELPRYDFPTGKSVKSGIHFKLESNTILLMEGIHALNPLMSEGIPEEKKFRIYVSALTTIKLDNHNYVPTTDNRLIRRIVRDNQFRGTSARSTIARWPSVRRGEDKWIFPYQENADVMFNSALIYELSVLRNHALPLLESVYENCEEHTLAAALTEFLRYFEPISDKELPPTSLLREFLGGSSFQY
ncbi:MAG: nucleoside kinase [Bacteroidaceae bacterium]|nr:nucleoside kinase [Bacteroidaceae bacterium]